MTLDNTKISPDILEISVKQLNFYYGDCQALRNISLEIYKNKITAMIGPSGCGKSTLLRTINRMNDLIPHVRIEGEVLFKDRSIFEKNIDLVELRKKIGMVFQRANPFPMTIYNNVAFGPRVHNMFKSKNELDDTVEKCLKAVGLWNEAKDKLKKSAFELSGGQQQRLCIARLLAVKPEVLLMDEPCSALDPIATMRIEELMLELKKDYTIVIVTHNMQQAARVSDSTGFFLLGELVEFSDTSKLFTLPSMKETQDYITGRFG
jgi:phosphate transport system ATP-binding protein